MTNAKPFSAEPRQSGTVAIDAFVRSIESRPDAAELFQKLAQTYWRSGDFRGYAECFRRSYRLKPTAGIPVEHHAAMERGLLAAERRDRANELIANGVAYSSVIATLCAAQARLGNKDAVSYLMDFESFLRQGTVAPPPGSSLETFNRLLANEIKSDLEFVGEPADRAMRHGWRMDGLRQPKTPALRTLMNLLRKQVDAYINALPANSTHPFVVSRPAKYELDGWAVVSDGASYHKPHLHLDAWLTGVYYVVEPEISRAPGSKSGWLRIGHPPDAKAFAEVDWECRFVAPVPGRFVLMPAYFWHDTEPMGVDQERICVAFEVQPSELLGHRDRRPLPAEDKLAQ